MQAAVSSCYHALPSPPPPDGHRTVPSASRHLWRTAHALQCIVNGDHATVFPVLSMVTLTFDLGIQSHLSERPNASSVQILRKSAQRFPRCFIHHKKVTDSTKNRTLCSLLCVVNSHQNQMCVCVFVIQSFGNVAGIVK